MKPGTGLRRPGADANSIAGPQGGPRPWRITRGSDIAPHARQASRWLRLPAGAAMLAGTLAGCSILGGGTKETATIYAPDPRVQADVSWPRVDWQLSISHPEAARMVDSQRIAVRPTPGELQVYKGATWAKTPTEQLADTVLRALEDSGQIPAVARQGSGASADYKLVMDLRRFEADYAGNAVPAATIEANVKLLHAPDNDIVGSRTFLQAAPAARTDVGAVTQAFSQALGRIGGEIAGWSLATGEAHERSGAHPPKQK